MSASPPYVCKSAEPTLNLAKSCKSCLKNGQQLIPIPRSPLLPLSLGPGFLKFDQQALAEFAFGIWQFGNFAQRKHFSQFLIEFFFQVEVALFHFKVAFDFFFHFAVVHSVELLARSQPVLHLAAAVEVFVVNRPEALGFFGAEVEDFGKNGDSVGIQPFVPSVGVGLRPYGSAAED